MNIIYKVYIKSFIVNKVDSINSLNNLTTFLSKFTYLLTLFRSNIVILFTLIDTTKSCFLSFPLLLVINA